MASAPNLDKQPPPGQTASSIKQTPRRLKLVMSSPNQKSSTDDPSTPETHNPSNSPPRPSYSPFTPTLSHSTMATDDSFNLPPPEAQSSSRSEPEWIDQPEPAPIDLEENTDAIALRAAISILQLQKQQSIKDIKTLNRMKRMAKQQPDTFLDELKSGRLSKTPSQSVRLDDDDEDDDHGEGDEHDKLTKEKNSNTGFDQFPTPQNVVRCPPVEWEKYHIFGEPLDRLHAQQRLRPGPVDYDMDGNEISSAPHVIAAPYRPFSDRINDSRSEGPRPP